jgi:hypothetical protein
MTQHEKQSKGPSWLDGYRESAKQLYVDTPRAAIAPAVAGAKRSLRYAANTGRNLNAAQKAFREDIPTTWSEAGSALRNSAGQAVDLAGKGVDRGLSAAGLDPETLRKDMPATLHEAGSALRNSAGQGADLAMQGVDRGLSAVGMEPEAFHDQLGKTWQDSTVRDVLRTGGDALNRATLPPESRPAPANTRLNKFMGNAADQLDAAQKAFREDLPNTPLVKGVANTYDWLTGPATPVPGDRQPSVGTPAVGGNPASTFGRNALLAGGLGLGAVGTYYLLNKLMQSRRKKQRASQFQGMYGPPKFASAADVLQTIQNSVGNAKNYALDTLGSGADKLQKHVEGGVQQWLEPSPDGFVSGALDKAMGVGGVAAGLGGAGLLWRQLTKHQRRQAEKENIEDARAEYLAALTGEKSAALDAAYEKYATLADVMNNISDGVKSVGRGAATAAEDYTAAQLLAAAAGVGIGGTYMYNKTRNNSLSANALKAQALKARMRSLPGTWIDPAELAKVKQMSMANNAEAT